MSYASQADMEARFGERELINLTDRTGQGAVDVSVLERALADASAEIDGFLAARYELPLSSTPVVLVRICADLARYYLHDDHAPDQVVERRKAAVATLRSLSRGEVSLGMSDTGDTPATSDGAEMVSGGRIWDRNDSRGYI